VNGIISERDYVCKIALLGRNSKSTKVKEIATMGTNIVVAKASDSVSDCMKKMLSRDIRHLPVVDDSGDVVGLMSIKDLVREVAREKDDLIHKIADFKLGRGGYFEHT
jgi:CBS domain-containing protein